MYLICAKSKFHKLAYQMIIVEENIGMEPNCRYYKQDKKEVMKTVLTENEVYPFRGLASYDSFGEILILNISKIVDIYQKLMSVIAKKMTYVSASQFSLIRYAAVLAFALPLVIYCKKEVISDKKRMFFLTLRGLLLASGLYLQIMAFKHLQLVEVSIVMSLSPFMSAIIARIFLKETLRLVQILVMLMIVCGVLLSLRLPQVLSDKTHTDFDISYVIGLIAAVAGMLCLSITSVVTRKIKEVHFSIMMLYVGIFGTAETAILNVTVFPLVKIECGWGQILCILIGIFSAISNYCLTQAYRLEPAGLVTAQKTSFDVLVTAVYQILFFTQFPDLYVVSGACIIIISLTILGIRNWVFFMPVTSKKRQKLKWILL